jgi:hypothetical protein
MSTIRTTNMFSKYQVCILPLLKANFCKYLITKFVIIYTLSKKITTKAISHNIYQAVFQPIILLKPIFLKAPFI